MIYDTYVRLQEKSTTKNSIILFFGQKITKSIYTWLTKIT